MKRILFAVLFSLTAVNALAGPIQKQQTAAALPLPPIRLPVWDAIQTLLHPPGSAQSSQNPDPIAAIRAFTVNDLQAALDDAKSQNPPDTIASNCYEALLPIVQSVAENPLPGKLGAFLAFQKARDLANRIEIVKNQVTNGPLNVACAPLVLSTQNSILMLAAKVGINAAVLVPK